MKNPFSQLRLALSLWRLEGYDGKPITLRHALEIAGLLRCVVEERGPRVKQEHEPF